MSWRRAVTVLLVVVVAGERVESSRYNLISRKANTFTLTTIDTVNLTISKSSVVATGLDDGYPVWTAVHVKKKLLVYVDSLGRNDLIHVVNTERPSETRTIKRQSAASDELVTSLAVDWITNKVYVAVEANGVRSMGGIEACLLDPPTSKNSPPCFPILSHGLDSLHSMVVDPLEGHVYWLNRVHKRVESAWLNGKHVDRQPFRSDIPEEQISLMAALTMDSKRNVLYFLRHRANRIGAEIVECGVYSRKTCKTFANGVDGFHLAVVENFVLWSSIRNATGIRLCELGECHRRHQVIQGTQLMTSFDIVHAWTQPNRTNPNPCALANGGCSHYCVLSPGIPWRTCMCPVGVRLLADDLTCDPRGVQRLLLIGASNGLYSLSLDTEDMVPIKVASANDEEGLQIVSIEFDNRDEMIYWLDKQKNLVWRTRLDGNFNERLTISSTIVKYMNSIVVDTASRNLIWTDSTNSRIELISLDHTLYQHTILSQDLESPSSLQLAESRLYYINQNGNQQKIERVWLDGSHREIIFIVPRTMFVSGITVDAIARQLYMVDGEKSSIISVPLDGGRTTIVAEGLKHPSRIEKMGGSLFASSMGGRSVTMLRQGGGGQWKQRDIAENVYGQMSLKTANLLTEVRLSKCTEENGGCDQICVVLPPNASKCLCTVGFELEPDNHSCAKTRAFILTSSNLTSTRSQLARLSLNHYNNERHSIFLPNITGDIRMIAPNPFAGTLYLVVDSGITKPSHVKLITMAPDGSWSRVVSEGKDLRYIRGMTVEPRTGNVVWSNSALRRVEMLNIHGNITMSLAWKDVDPHHITIDPRGDRIFFSNEFGGTHRIMVRFNLQILIQFALQDCPLKGDMNGGSVFLDLNERIEALALDNKSGYLIYLTLSSLNAIGLSGQERRKLLDNNGQIGRMSAFQSLLYYYNPMSNSIQRLDLVSGHASLVHNNVTDIDLMLLVYEDQLDKHDVLRAAECEKASNELGCLCVPEQELFQCKCGDQFVQDPMGRCLPPSKFVLLAVRNRLVRFKIRENLHSFDYEFDRDPYVALPVDNIGHPLAVQYDVYSPNRFVYWIDGFDRDGADLKRASDTVHGPGTTHLNLNGDSNCSQLFDVVVDTIGRQLFVSCTHDRNDAAGFVHVWRIEASDNLHYIGRVVDGSRKSTVTQTTPSPRRIAIFNRLRTLFYVDENPALDSPIIIRCTLEGRHCYPVETSMLHFHQTRIQADLASYRLVYTAEDGIWSRDVFLGTDVRHHLMISPFGISSADSFIQISTISNLNDKAVLFTAPNQSRYEDQVYLLAKNQAPVEFDQLRPVSWTRDLADLGRRRTALLVVGTPSALGEIIDQNPQAKEWPCAKASCSHICVTLRDQRAELRSQFECLCPVGYSKSQADGHLCEPNIVCDRWEFPCHDGKECVHQSQKCDGVRDCRDGSDESPLRCKLNAGVVARAEKEVAKDWVCEDQKSSIPRGTLCNGQWDCEDGSDEAHCRCDMPGKFFDCANWAEQPTALGADACVPRAWLCDGRAQCPNGADESALVCHENRPDPALWPDLGALLDQTKWLALFAIAVLLLFATCMLCCACFAYKRQWLRGRYRDRDAAGALINAHSRRHTEAKLIVPGSHQNGGLVEVALRTFPAQTTADVPIYASASQVGAKWPPPPSPAPNYNYYNTLPAAPDALYYRVRSGAGEEMATLGATTSASSVTGFSSTVMLPAPAFAYDRRFYAPPPSAASLSTYGVAQPARLPMHTGSGRGPQSVASSTGRSSHRQQHARPPRRRNRRRRQNSCAEPGQGRLAAENVNAESEGGHGPAPPPYEQESE